MELPILFFMYVIFKKIVRIFLFLFKAAISIMLFPLRITFAPIKDILDID